MITQALYCADTLVRGQGVVGVVGAEIDEEQLRLCQIRLGTIELRLCSTTLSGISRPEAHEWSSVWW